MTAVVAGCDLRTETPNHHPTASRYSACPALQRQNSSPLGSAMRFLPRPRLVDALQQQLWLLVVSVDQQHVAPGPIARDRRQSKPCS
jgi:hypothetical protein